MNNTFDQFKATWQQKAPKQPMQGDVMRKIEEWDKAIGKENLAATIAFSVTIFLLGAIVMPLIDTTLLFACITALIFLMGGQSMLLWARQFQHAQSKQEAPAVYLRSWSRKLRYHLLVARVFIPIYLLLLALISSVYCYELLAPFSTTYAWLAIGSTCLFITTVGIFGVRRRYKEDQAGVIPLIQEIEEMRLQFEES